MVAVLGEHVTPPDANWGAPPQTGRLVARRVGFGWGRQAKPRGWSEVRAVTPKKGALLWMQSVHVATATRS